MAESGKPDLIRASEMGEYVFCALAWRMRADGHRPAAGQAARAAGQEWHLGHGRSVRSARHLRALSAITAGLAIVVAALILLRWWG